MQDQLRRDNAPIATNVCITCCSWKQSSLSLSRYIYVCKHNCRIIIIFLLYKQGMNEARKGNQVSRRVLQAKRSTPPKAPHVLSPPPRPCIVDG